MWFAPQTCEKPIEPWQSMHRCCHLQAESLDGASSQPVAIKALSLRGLRGDWKALELFQREARTLEALQHPGIPKYLEYFEVDTPRDKGFYLVQVNIRQKKDVVGSAINAVLHKCVCKAHIACSSTHHI